MLQSGILNTFVTFLHIMKKLFLVVTLILSQIIFAQNKISIDSVSSHIGDTVQICSKVYGVKALEKVTFINVGRAYPNSRPIS